MSFAHALKWSFLSELAAKAIQPVVFIILARLLTPADFGVMSAALMVIAFSQIFWEAGMGKALVQRQTDIEDAANVAFWINIGLGFVIAAVLYLVAGPVAQTVFHDERVTAVLQVMTLQVMLGAVSSVHIALLQKEMGFKKLFWARLFTVGLPGLASIPLAWNGMGYWALVAGTLIGQAAQAAIFWHLSAWRPKCSFNLLVAKSVTKFGSWVSASAAMGWFFSWADSLIVGIYLGSHELGLYRTGNLLVAMIFSICFSPALPVIYSHLSSSCQDNDKIRGMFRATFGVVTFVAIPIAAVLFTYSHQLSEILFGTKWDGIAGVIAILALMHGYAWTVGFNGEIYRVLGRPAYETTITAITVGVYLIAYILSAPFGLETFLWTRLSLALGATVLHLIVIKNLLSIPLLPMFLHLLRISLVSGTIVVAVYSTISDLTATPWGVLLGGVTLFGVLIGSSLLLTNRDGLLKDISMLITPPQK